MTIKLAKMRGRIASDGAWLWPYGTLPESAHVAHLKAEVFRIAAEKDATIGTLCDVLVMEIDEVAALQRQAQLNGDTIRFWQALSAGLALMCIGWLSVCVVMAAR